MFRFRGLLLKMLFIILSGIFPHISLYAQLKEKTDSLIKQMPKPEHTFRSDISYTSLPLITTGIILRHERKNFRDARNKFQYNFHHTTDNYTQYTPLLLATGLKIAGYEGRSSWGRYLTSTAASYAVMGALVNGMKYSLKEQRPDGSTYNSFPSGHTATAFAAATILHKEYGLTRTPWISVAGYGLATMTGVMRVLNNRHWISDTFAGAGIGILSTELGYAIGDLFFKNKGLLRSDIKGTNDLPHHPSFFSVQVGMGIGKQSLDIATKIPEIGAYYDDEPIKKLRLSQATVVSAESAYFLTPYFGLGGQLKVTSQLMKNWQIFAQDQLSGLIEFDPQLEGFIDEFILNVESDHFSDFTFSIGPYFSLPISPRMALGGKLLIGRNYTQGVEINATVRGHQRDIDQSVEIENGLHILTYEVKGTPADNGKEYETKWDYMDIKANRSINVGTGISFTYAYKSSMAWRFFLDYDWTPRHYKVSYQPTAFIKDAARNLTFDGKKMSVDNLPQAFTTDIKKNMSKFVLGGALCISF